MKAWAVYEITHHGEPVFPVFITKSQHHAEYYIQYRDKSQFCSKDQFYIKQVDIDVEKIGVTWKRTRNKKKIIHERDQLVVELSKKEKDVDLLENEIKKLNEKILKQQETIELFTWKLLKS